MKIAVWNIEALTGYKPITTFYEDFSIADHYLKKISSALLIRSVDALKNGKTTIST